MFSNLWQLVRRPTRPSQRRGRPGARRPFRPEVLPLEERAVPSIVLANEVEGNDTFDHATPLPTLGSSVIASGAIQAPHDVDYYSFRASPGSRVWAFMDTGGPPDPGANSRHGKLTLLASDGKTPLETDIGDGTGTGGGTRIDTLDSPLIAGHALPAAGGVFFLAVAASDGTGVISPYKLYVTVTSTTDGPDVEPANNGRTSATPLIGSPSHPVRSGTVRTGVLNDQDNYQVKAHAGDVLFVAADAELSGSGGANLVVDLLGPDGGTLVSANSSAAAGSNPDHPAEGFAYVAAAPGPYFVRVRCTGGTGLVSSCQYRLMVSGNNEPGAFQFGAPSYRVGEGGTAVLTVNRVAGSAGSASVNYAVTGGTATPGSDFTPVSGTLTFADGQTSQTITIPTNADAVAEGSENLVVRLSSPTGGATVVAGATTVVTITDDAVPLTDVTPLVGVARGRVRFNPATRHFRQRVTLRNLSGQVLPGPLWLVLDGLPRKVHLRNANGMSLAHGTPGSPFVVANLAGDGLAPGGSVSLVLDFVNPRLRRIRYTPLVLEGVGLL
jgi:hypothetical protein